MCLCIILRVFRFYNSGNFAFFIDHLGLHEGAMNNPAGGGGGGGTKSVLHNNGVTHKWGGSVWGNKQELCNQGNWVESEIHRKTLVTTFSFYRSP